MSEINPNDPPMVEVGAVPKKLHVENRRIRAAIIARLLQVAAQPGRTFVVWSWPKAEGAATALRSMQLRAATPKNVRIDARRTPSGSELYATCDPEGSDAKPG